MLAKQLCFQIQRQAMTCHRTRPANDQAQAHVSNGGVSFT